MKDFLIYTLARFAIFGICYAVVIGFYLMLSDSETFPVVWPVLLAAILSVGVSAFVLRGMRERVAENVSARASRMSDKFEEMRAKEDQD